jgi:phosphopantothenoylcysteine decarboxylase/phosphopantothenate--cysteine ligase
MNATMLGQASTQRNVQSLSNDGFTVLDTQKGWQACKTVGQGRMEEPLCLIEALYEAVVKKP